MTRIGYLILLTFITILITSCATSNRLSSNDTFYVDKETLIEKSKEAIAENNLRIRDEEELEDGSYQINSYRDESRYFTSEEQAINRVSIIISPLQGEDGFKISIQEPRIHAMARSADTIEYRGRLLRTLNELLPSEENAGTEDQEG